MIRWERVGMGQVRCRLLRTHTRVPFVRPTVTITVDARCRIRWERIHGIVHMIIIGVVRERVDDIFRRSPRRILVFMDDIDRLTPREMHQLLLIVRAVADFPNTTYVLSFDYEVVVGAIGDKLAVDGRTYLEKVIQLQIDVPLPGRKKLGRMFLGQLGEIDPDTMHLDPESQRQFRMLFESGVKHFLATPRACRHAEERRCENH